MPVCMRAFFESQRNRSSFKSHAARADGLFEAGWGGGGTGGSKASSTVGSVRAFRAFRAVCSVRHIPEFGAGAYLLSVPNGLHTIQSNNRMHCAADCARFDPIRKMCRYAFPVHPPPRQPPACLSSDNMAAVAATSAVAAVRRLSHQITPHGRGVASSAHIYLDDFRGVQKCISLARSLATDN